MTTETLTQAASDVLAERRRQIEIERWTTEHDDRHGHGALSFAGAAYAIHASSHDAARAQFANVPPVEWPWDYGWWRPSTPRRDLVKAGALIIAEIERLDRAAAKEPAR